MRPCRSRAGEASGIGASQGWLYPASHDDLLRIAAGAAGGIGIQRVSAMQPPAPDRRAIPKRSYLGTPATAPGPSGPSMLPAIGAIRRDPLQFLARTWHEYGDVVQFPIPRPPSYLVTDPDAVRTVLTGDGRTWGKDTIQYRALSLVTGEGLLTADTEAWSRQRPLVQPAFHHSMLDRLVADVDAVACAIADDWGRADTIVDVDQAMMQGALEVVGRALMGADFSPDADQLTAATLAALDVVIQRARVPISPPAWVPTPANRRLRAALRELDGAADRILAARADEPGDDMVGHLLSAHSADGARLTRQEVRDQIVTFLVAGHETVASALTWAWALLAVHPEAMARLAEESAQVLGEASPTVADIGRLSYARAVFDETLRLRPPAWLITRASLAPVDAAGYAVPAGALVIMSPWLVHRHPDRWPAAGEFRPERFLDGSADRRAFIPYGAGSRQCIGRDFAALEGVLMLARLAQRCTVAYPGTAELPRSEPGVTLRPVGGLPMRVAART